MGAPPPRPQVDTLNLCDTRVTGIGQGGGFKEKDTGQQNVGSNMARKGIKYSKRSYKMRGRSGQRKPRTYRRANWAGFSAFAKPNQTSLGYKRRANTRSGAELKAVDTNVGFGPMSDNHLQVVGRVSGFMVDIDKGDNYDERIGRKVKAKSLHIRGAIESTSGTTAKNETVYFFALVLDTQTQGVVCTPAQVFKSILHPTNIQTELCPLRNLDNISRFKVLHWEKKRLTMPKAPWDGVDNTQTEARWVFNRDFVLDFTTTYAAGTAAATTISAIRDNNLYMIFGADTQIGMNAQARLRYTDA